MQTEPGGDEVWVLDLSAVEISGSQENAISLINTCYDSCYVQWVSLQSPLVLGSCKPIEVIFRVVEACTIIFNKVLFMFFVT